MHSCFWTSHFTESACFWTFWVMMIMNIDCFTTVARAEIRFVTKSINNDIDFDLSKNLRNEAMKNWTANTGRVNGKYSTTLAVAEKMGYANKQVIQKSCVAYSLIRMGQRFTA